MEATTEEKQNLEQLNQERTPDKIESEEKSTESSSHANMAEMLLLLLPAIAVDAIDVLDLTGFGAILVRFVDLPFLGILMLWRLMKTGIKKDATFQLLLVSLAFLVEISPFGIIPTWTIFVIYTYIKDTNIGKKTIGKIEKINKTKK